MIKSMIVGKEPAKDSMTTLKDKESYVVLERLRMYASKHVTGQMLKTMTLSTRLGIFDELVTELVAEVLAEEVDNRSKEVSFEVPATWWDHFKRDYFPDWLLYKFPIKQKTLSKTVTFRRLATYPKLPHVYPNTGDIKYKQFIGLKGDL